MEIRDVYTAEGLIKALNKLGIRIDIRDIVEAKQRNLLPDFPIILEGKRRKVKFVFDFVDKIEEDALAASMTYRTSIPGLYIDRVIIGPTLIELARKYQDPNFIWFAMDHEFGHYYDNLRPRGIGTLWNFARDVVINEHLIEKYSQFMNKKHLSILESMILTKDKLNKDILNMCMQSGIADCNQYLITDEDLHSKYATLRVYEKIFELYKKVPEATTEIIEKYEKKQHGKYREKEGEEESEEGKEEGGKEGKEEEIEKKEGKGGKEKGKEKKEGKGGKEEGGKEGKEVDRLEIIKDEIGNWKPERSAGLDRLSILFDVEPSKVELPWDKLLENLLMGAIVNFKKLMPNWSKPNRRFIEYYEEEGIFIPSLKQLQPPNGFIIVDSSGSISNDLYAKFIGVIRDVMIKAKPGEVTAVIFSVGIVEDGIIKLTPYNIPEKLRTRRAAGGTAICEAIDYVSDHIKRGDFVVVLSDFEIFDQDKCMDKIEKLGEIASTAIQVFPPYEMPDIKWKNWKQIVMDELQKEKL